MAKLVCALCGKGTEIEDFFTLRTSYVPGKLLGDIPASAWVHLRCDEAEQRRMSLSCVRCESLQVDDDVAASA